MLACEYFLNKYLRDLEILMGNFSKLIIKNLGEILEKFWRNYKFGRKLAERWILKIYGKGGFGLDWSWFWI